MGEEGGDGGLPEFSDPLHVDEDSTDVSRETSNYTQVGRLNSIYYVLYSLKILHFLVSCQKLHDFKRQL